MKHFLILTIGIMFGYVLMEAQVVSWYRIQEMFLFDNFHMYGVIGTAIVCSAIFLQIYKRWSMHNNLPVQIKKKPLHRGTIIGGILFGLGWSITGACPGPIYVLIGGGQWIYLIVLFAALAGVLIYGYTLGQEDQNHST